MGKQGKIKSFISTKSFILLIFLIVIALQSACTGNVSAVKTDTVELRLAHFFPGTHPAETELIKGWADAIKEATGGKVIITSYPGETLLKAADIYNGVVEGVADIGLSCFSYNMGRFPEMEAFELPGIVYKNSRVASKVAWEGIKELNSACVQDTKLLMVIATGPGDLFTKTRVTKMDDIKGMQIRATGLTAETLKLTGAIPAGMPQSEAYEALQKGLASGNLAPIEVLKTWNHADVTNYLLRTPFLYNNLFYITMNLEKWDSLSEDLQNIIVEISEKFHDEVGIGLWDRQNEIALKWAVEEKGITVSELSPEDMEVWIKAVEPMIDKYISEKGEAGKRAVEVAKRLSEKFNSEY